MQPLLLLSPFILATSAQKLQQRQGLDGDSQSYYAPLQYSLPPGVTLALSTPAVNVATAASSTALPNTSDNVNIPGGSAVSGSIGSAAAAYSATAASAFPSLTGA